MTNENYLEGIRCPRCGNEDHFTIESRVTCYVTDDGAEPRGDTEWGDESHCACPDCGLGGALRAFRIAGEAAEDSHGGRTSPTRQGGGMKYFDGYEVHGVAEFDDGKDGRFCEQVPDGEAQFWSLYGHIPGEGLECIGDFKTREDAEEVRRRIAGPPALPEGEGA